MLRRVFLSSLRIALALGIVFCGMAARFLLRRDRGSAKTLFLGSILYLPLLLGLLVAARR